tara:strand:- start:6516 stop:7994 length:1479 start_codon:yes stop_codon:yes gene_type:complete
VNKSPSYILLILVLGLTTTLNAQYFNKVFDFETGREYSSRIRSFGSNYLISAGGSDTSGSEKLGYLVLNKDGNKLYQTLYPIPNALVRNGDLILLKDKDLLDFRTYQYWDSAGEFRSKSWLIKLNNKGDTLWTKFFSDSTVHNLLSRTLIETPDSGLMLICSRNRNPDYDPIVIRTDKKGNELWRKAINTPGREVAYTIIRHPNGDYYLGGGGNTGGTFRSWIARIDDSAKVKFEKRYHMTGGGSAALLSVLEDSNLIFGTDTFIYKQRDSYYKKQIIKVEPKRGDVIWRQIHDSVMQGVAYNKVIEGDSNELYVIGRHDNDGWTSYTLTRMTSTGDTVWKHNYFYEKIDTENYLWDFIRTSDKGFIFCGDVNPDNSNQDVWVLKVDSNGCMSPECKSRVYDIRLGIDRTRAFDVNIKVFPNPVVDELHVSFTEKQNIAWHYQLIDQKGRVLKRGSLNPDDSQVDMKPLPTGVYLLQLESELGYRVFRVVKE